MPFSVQYRDDSSVKCLLPRLTLWTVLRVCILSYAVKQAILIEYYIWTRATHVTKNASYWWALSLN